METAMLRVTIVLALLVLGATVPASAQFGGPFGGPGVPSYNPGVPSYNPGVPSQSPAGFFRPGPPPRFTSGFPPVAHQTPVMPQTFIIVPQRRRPSLDDPFAGEF
jgi:hypothetical protein